MRLIQQSLDIFHIYGKQPEQAKNILLGFEMVLEGRDIGDITKAFEKWMREEPNFPAPANILGKVQEIEKVRRESAQDRQRARMAPRVSKVSRVPWYGKMWDDYTASDKAALAAHLAGMDPLKRANYRKYLKQFCNVPAEATA